MPDETPSDGTRSGNASSDDLPGTPADTELEVSRQPQQAAILGSRWVAPTALLLAVVATALAIWALVGESSDAPAMAAGEGDGDSKALVCTAFDTVSTAVPLQTNNNLGPDPVAQAAVAANARLALFGGGQYLLNWLSSDTPAELADPVRSFATDLQAIGMFALAGVNNAEPEQAARLARADATRQQITELCQ